ncbi:NAD(P)/FAD-dependent oxidoreductase [Acidianus manzaensis]|uniref:Pyridine nucleotide-disulfide oxidoreductase n=1 Tax=Acidianus manzaensis TaxID=282676 RepID=A0A1W6K2D0_9CREN|nr:FAD-dependent oxidoreductase [Acidianus manzaensis]ARM76688.1 pyridine nucleotide-disulfide oxidoreductase [Acidianus manzaensis]
MKVLILGSGYAGLTVAHRIREHSKDIDIQIVSKSSLVRENTIFPLLLTDEVKVEDTEFNAKDVMEKKGVNFVEAEVEGISLNSNEVKTSKGTFDYDYLFIALGGGYEENFEKIPGHEFAFMHHTLDGFLGLKKALYEAEDGVKVFVGNAQASPIEGPSYQVALIAEYILRKRNKDREIYLSTQSPKGVFGILPFDWVSEKANKYFEKRGIKILKGKYVKEVKKDKVVLNDGTEVYADIKSVLPTLSAPEVVRNSGLELANNFVKVELPTFKAYKNVYALGDSAIGMVPAKTARSAMVSAENAVSSFLRETKGIYLPMYSQGVLCIMEGGDDGGILRFDKNSRDTKVVFDINRNYVMFKKMYSRLLVNSAFNVKFHASLTI